MVTDDKAGWSEITEIKANVADIKSKLAEMYTALMGSSLTKDGGLVSRVLDSEHQIERLTTRIQNIEKNSEKHKQLIQIIWTASGAVGGGIVIAIISHFLK